MHKIGQSGGFLGRILGPLLKTGSPLIGNVLKPSAKSVLIPLGLTAAASATDPAFQQKMFGSGCSPSDSALHHSDLALRDMALIISNEEMNDIVKIVKSLEESGFLIKGTSRTIKNEAEEQKGEFLEILLGALSPSFLGNLLAGKGTGKDTIREVKVHLELVRIFNTLSGLVANLLQIDL